MKHFQEGEFVNDKDEIKGVFQCCLHFSFVFILNTFLDENLFLILGTMF